MTLAGRSFGMSAVSHPCHDTNGEQPHSQWIGSSLSGSIPKQLAHPRSTILEGPETENYCTSYGKWVAWPHSGTAETVLTGSMQKRRGGSRAALADRNDPVH